MQQQFRSFNVPEEPIAQARASMRTFDQSGYIGNYKCTKVAKINHAEMWFQRGERIVSNLRTSSGHSRDERRLSGIWKTNQSDVSQQLQFELEIQLFSLAATLMVARCAIRRAREVRISKSAPATSRGQPLSAIVVQVVKKIACCRVKDLGSDWNSNDHVSALFARPVRSFAVQS